MKNKKLIVITGSAGFVGFHLSRELLKDNWKVVGIDNLSDYYDIKLKLDRHSILKLNSNFVEIIQDLQDFNALKHIINNYKPSFLIHLAAQAGVRKSIKQPKEYLDNNVNTTFNILECVKETKLKHLLIASSSSVYGNSLNVPFFEFDETSLPVSFYGATKKMTEILSHYYSHFYKIPITAFRFFTVYGPWGRPDMAYFKFAKAILSEEKIDVYNNGEMYRDFTYIDDLVKSIKLLIEKAPKELDRNLLNKKNNLFNPAPWRVINIGTSKKIKLLDFISILEKHLNKKARKNYVKFQEADVAMTWANSDLLEKLISFRPETNLYDGLKKFVDWYLDYYKMNK